MKPRLAHPLLAVATYGGIALLYAPMAAVVLYSFNSTEKGSVWGGLSLRWYAQLASDPELNRRTLEIREAALNTVILGLVSTAIATFIGTLLAVGIQRYPWPPSIARMFDTLVDLPVVTPDIIFAAALILSFSLLRSLSPIFMPGMTSMIVGHVTFQIAFVALVVRSRLAAIGSTLSEAACDLYAGPWYQFRRVTLPLLWPAIVGGALLAFTLSLDDFVISFFTCSPQSVTLPIYVYHSQLRGLRTDLFAVSSLFMLCTVVLVLLTERLTRWRKE